MKKKIGIGASVVALLFGTLFVLMQQKNNQTDGWEAASVTTEKGYPKTIEMFDDSGKKIEQIIEAEPKRIVVIGQGYVEWMLEFGQADKIVGVAYLDDVEDEAIAQLPLISKMWPSKESILALQPDLIVSMSSAFQDERIGSIDFWNEREIPVVAGINYTIGRTIDAYDQDIATLGAALDISKITNEYLKEQHKAIDQVLDKKSKDISDISVLVVGISDNKIYYYGPELSLLDEIITDVGGKFVELPNQPSAPISEETMLSINPDKIIITEFQKDNDAIVLAKLLDYPKLKEMNAIKNKNVEVVDYTSAVRGNNELPNLYQQVFDFLYENGGVN